MKTFRTIWQLKCVFLRKELSQLLKIKTSIGRISYNGTDSLALINGVIRLSILICVKIIMNWGIAKSCLPITYVLFVSITAVICEKNPNDLITEMNVFDERVLSECETKTTLGRISHIATDRQRNVVENMSLCRQCRLYYWPYNVRCYITCRQNDDHVWLYGIGFFING